MPIGIRAPLLVVAAAALLAGLYARFKGIGLWPLGVDEFYISRSIDNILRGGLPRFNCGGFYNRGALYQYVVAGARLLGLAPETAGRSIAAMCSLATLPAAYLLAKRIQDSLAGWLTMVILCVSVWEVEMGRFARMYAPFQMIFVWYAVCFLRYSLDRRREALKWMIALAVLGAFTWEGGVALAVANVWAVLLTHDGARLRPVQIGQVVALALLIMPLSFIGTNDFREAGGPPAAATNHFEGAGPAPNAAPAGARGDATGNPPGAVEPQHAPGLAMQLTRGGLAPLVHRPFWMAGWAILCVLGCVSLRWVRPLRRHWLAAAALGAALVAAALHLFTGAAGVLAAMLLAGLIDWHELFAPKARIFVVTLAGFLVFWMIFDRHAGGLPNIAVDRGAIGIGVEPAAQRLFGFPDVLDVIIRPWMRTLPVLTTGLGVVLGALFLVTVGARNVRADAAAQLLSLVLVMVLIVGSAPTPRIETRYTFFLYPAMIALAVAALMRLIARLPLPHRAGLAAGAFLPLLCFAATEDFQPRHLIRIDSADINFRVDMSAALAAHYYPRADVRAVAEWMAAHRRPGDAVITGIPNLAPYYADFDYFFLDEEDGRYESYVCRDGVTERWTDHRLLHSMQALRSVAAAHGRIYASVYPEVETRLERAAATEGWVVTRVWKTSHGDADVLLITTSKKE
jgi:hypothetical protein